MQHRKTLPCSLIGPLLLAATFALWASGVPLAQPASGSTSATIPPAKPLVPAATLEGPIPGTISEPLDPRNTNLAKLGYVESEWFASGTATRYKELGKRTVNGRWHLVPDGTAPYKTRFIVRMPTDPSKFSGVVAVEWINVSAGELAADWSYLSDDAFVRTGTAWVGVSVQALGVDGGRPILNTQSGEQNSQAAASAQELANQNKGLKVTNPARYGSLGVPPGDAYSFDIYSQVAAALRANGQKIFSGGHVKRILGIGESQSAAYLTAYVNGVEPLAHAFDGFFIHSRFSGAANFDGSPGNLTTATGVGYHIRTDLPVPVFVYENEGDVDMGYWRAWQPDTSRIRVWETAGTAHSDSYLAGNYPGICPTPINDGPQHWVVQAAYTDLVHWVMDGTPPPHAKPLEMDDTTIKRDSHGNALGGIRTPDVDAPIAKLSGIGSSRGPSFCKLLGSTTPFSNATLHFLYPTKQAYISKFNASLNKAIRGGFVRSSDRAAYEAQAAAVKIPS